ncbi:unnamed protein product [Clonostachys rhizophaga]|uniref:Uncharacterized protein n=1 Tax=Clonostachys rhizophaga TaxID=160324 RepID=A0A9N9W050_9HYPO|nr:unnamed protein product [Clonostachys rhizophaga]
MSPEPVLADLPHSIDSLEEYSWEEIWTEIDESFTTLDTVTPMSPTASGAASLRASSGASTPNLEPSKDTQLERLRGEIGSKSNPIDLCCYGQKRKASGPAEVSRKAKRSTRETTPRASPCVTVYSLQTNDSELLVWERRSKQWVDDRNGSAQAIDEASLMSFHGRVNGEVGIHFQRAGRAWEGSDDLNQWVLSASSEESNV